MSFVDTTRRDALARSLCARISDNRRSIAELRRLESALGAIERKADDDPLHVYVAGASAEIDRARGVTAALVEYGIVVTSSWPEVVSSVGEANPTEASREDRARWSATCLDEVASSDVILVLVPERATTIGAWWEAGSAWTLGKRLVLAGATKRTVFAAHGEEFTSDLRAVAHVINLARTARQQLDTYEGDE